MAEKDALFGPYRAVDVSYNALIIGRMVDRYCRAPGTYAIKVVIPAHRRSLWQVTLSSQELIRVIEIGRRP